MKNEITEELLEILGSLERNIVGLCLWNAKIDA